MKKVQHKIYKKRDFFWSLYSLFQTENKNIPNLLTFGPKMVMYIPGKFEFVKLCTSRAFALYVACLPSCLTRLRDFAPYVSYLRASSTRFARLFHAPYALYLCAFKSFYNGFVVQQKLSIHQRPLKALQTLLLLCWSINSCDTF